MTAAELRPDPATVRAVREAAGLSQQAAAELVHMTTFQRWSEYERGIAGMHPSTWELFCIKVGRHPVYKAVSEAQA